MAVLTKGIHQVHLHAVGHQRVWQLRKEALHGSSYSVHREVLLHQVQGLI